MIARFFRRARAEPPPLPKMVPPGIRVYAVGDIHGRADLLAEIHRQVIQDLRQAPVRRAVLVYLGDYIDRGHESARVIDMLLAGPPPGFERAHYLMGNHEAAMLEFLTEPSLAHPWLGFGGLETLFSYGIGLPAGLAGAERARVAAEGLVQRMPPAHRAFFEKLELSRRIGGLYFVHAGIRPGVALDRQVPEDQLWIRDEFLLSGADHGVRVVHGHTIASAPEILPNRVGLDTGAFGTGKLTCGIFEQDRVRILQS